MGLRDQILDATNNQRAVKQVQVQIAGHQEPWFVGELTAGERDQWEAYQQKADEDDPDNRASFLALCLCDGNGKRLFTIDDVPRLAKLPYGIVRPLIIAAKALNGMDLEVAEAARTFRQEADAGTHVRVGGDSGDDS